MSVREDRGTGLRRVACAAGSALAHRTNQCVWLSFTLREGAEKSGVRSARASESWGRRTSTSPTDGHDISSAPPGLPSHYKSDR
jgi:hypothetical protein